MSTKAHGNHWAGVEVEVEAKRELASARAAHCRQISQSRSLGVCQVTTLNTVLLLAQAVSSLLSSIIDEMEAQNLWKRWR